MAVTSAIVGMTRSLLSLTVVVGMVATPVSHATRIHATSIHDSTPLAVPLAVPLAAPQPPGTDPMRIDYPRTDSMRIFHPRTDTPGTALPAPTERLTARGPVSAAIGVGEPVPRPSRQADGHTGDGRGGGLGGSVDRWTPEPAWMSDPGESSTGSTTDRQERIRQAILPLPTGDPFLDEDPPGLADAAPGTVLATRDVTDVAAPMIGVPVDRVVQYLVRSNDAAGRPSRATATLVEPTTPWTGSGPRPVLVNATPIDALGSRCTPAYTLAHGPGPYTNFMDFLPPTTMLAAVRGYSVLVPDHEGPTMAYADPLVAGQSILDAIRGMDSLRPGQEGAPVAVTGYSGGAIAAVGTAGLAGRYAPELVPRIVGVAAGGVPADFRLLLDSMSGNLASGLLLAAVFGIARQHPEVSELANNLALQLGSSAFKDQCTVPLIGHGLTLAPVRALTVDDTALDSPTARRLYARIDMGTRRADVPLYVYHGAQEFWLPISGTRSLVHRQCALGASVTYREVLGEHAIASVTGYPEALGWLDARLQGVPATAGCTG